MNLGMALMLELLFGLAFNKFTEVSERHGWMDGYTSIYVVLGVAVTVTMMGPIIGWEAVMLLAAGFALSGAPMIVGSIARHVTARARDRELAIRDLRERGA
jgi:hypothetical protein